MPALARELYANWFFVLFWVWFFFFEQGKGLLPQRAWTSKNTSHRVLGISCQSRQLNELWECVFVRYQAQRGAICLYQGKVHLHWLAQICIYIYIKIKPLFRQELSISFFPLQTSQGGLGCWDSALCCSCPTTGRCCSLSGGATGRSNNIELKFSIFRFN